MCFSQHHGTFSKADIYARERTVGMQEVTFDLQTITPMFLAGADQATAELRAPSFRGEMRYWYRALVGGLVGTSGEELKKVKEAETTVFGATDTGSAISIKVSAASQEPRPFTEQISVRVGGQWQATGKGYLLWTMAQSGRADRGNLKQARWYFLPGTRFQVTLATHNDVEVAFKKGMAAFWLLTHLGGIGSRSRRCAGSLQATGDITSFPFSVPESAQTLQDQLTNGIRAARDLYGSSSSPLKEAAFDALSPATCRIWILRNGEQPWRSADDVMRDIGESLQDYRGTIKPLWRRKVFGLPLKDVDMKARRASPLLLRVTKLQREQYVGVAVLFKTKSEGVSMADYTLIENWVSRDFPNALEVGL